MSIHVLKNFKNNRCWSSIDSEEVNIFLNSDQSNFKDIGEYSYKANNLMENLENFLKNIYN